jgi:hypothetical protein
MDNKRRKFLKILFIGGGFGLLVKFFGIDLFKLISGSQSIENLGNFQVSKNGDNMIFFDKKGKEIFIIDNDK